MQNPASELVVAFSWGSCEYHRMHGRPCCRRCTHAQSRAQATWV
jgi:hypothetical protein